ncbi:hypothetical protein EMCRGX_G019469 [Ephydatia muelleri]
MEVVYPKLKFILCIDSLHFSNVDEVNWIWMYLCSESYTINQVNKFHLVIGNIIIQRMPQLRRIQIIVEHLCVLQHGNWWRGYLNCLHTQVVQMRSPATVRTAAKMQMDAHLMSDNITNILHVVNESENNDHK